MLTYADWVNRRVEQISFIDDETVQRRVSVDFQLPRSYAKPEDTNLKKWFVPLALLKKGVLLVDFDLRDEEGSALPLLASQETHGIGGAMLVSTASTILKRHSKSLGRGLTQRLTEIPGCQPDQAEEAVEKALGSRRAGDGQRLLSDDPLFRPLAEDLSQYFLVLAPVSRPGDRRVVKFSYLEFLDNGKRKAGTRLLTALGWRTMDFRFYTPGAAMARSYHCEFTAPERLEITRGELLELRGEKERKARVTGSRGRVHFQLEGVRSDSKSVLRAGLRARRAGLPGMSAILALGISMLLTAGLLFLEPVLSSEDTAAPALLVAIPALLAAYLSAPGEHRLASRLLVGIRWLTGAVGLVVFVAAASLAGGESHEGTVEIVWLGATTFAWLLTAALVLSAMLPRVGQRRFADR